MTTLSIHGEKITLLDVSQADAEPAVVISLRATQVNPQLLHELERILTSYPGRAPVHVRLDRRGATSVLLNLVPFQVTPEPAFCGDIKALLGSDAIGRP